MIFELRSDFLKVEISYVSVGKKLAVFIPKTAGLQILILHKDHIVRISHRDAGHSPGPACCFDRLIDHGTFFRQNRDFRSLQNRPSHIDSCSQHLSVPAGKLQLLHFSEALHGNFRFPVRHSVIIDILADTANSVPAHAASRPVLVVHFHFKIRLFRRIDKDHSVAADSEMQSRELFHKLRFSLLRKLFRKSIHIDVVISAAFHLRKMKQHCSSPSL